MKNKVKQMLSIAMTVCMLSTMAPLTTYGADLDFADDVSVSTEAEDDAEVTADTEDVEVNEDQQVEEDSEISVETEENEETDDAEEELFTSDDAEAETEDLFAESAGISIAGKPADGTTSGQPFAAGTGGSQYFRIPAMVTLSDGTIVAATDARWNTTFDGYCLDTIVSRSTDQGATWNYTFANYLGDNGNVKNESSTAFIDPVLVADKNDTIYMMVDLFPAGGYIGNISAGTGYDSEGHLKLSTSGNSGSSSYDYYLDGTTIYNAKTKSAVEGLSVDDHFNLTGTYNNTTYNTNLFFSDSPFKVLKTSYLYLTRSTDGGQSWSAPMMLNPQVKNSSETFYGVGPGRGLTTSLSDGTERIILPCYNYNGGVQYTSVIYSDDGGSTWQRSNSMTSTSSEATLAEADGKIYMFTRGGGYYVSSDHGTTWGNKQSVSGISYHTDCQINAITYSQKIDGKTAILLSAPTSGRANGKIFAGLVQDDGSIQWKYTYSVNTGTYQYSCLTELKDGTVALLYENGAASEWFTTYKIETIAPDAVIGTPEKKESTLTDEKTGVQVHFLEENVTSMTVEGASVDSIKNDPYVAYDVTPGDGYNETSAEVTMPLGNILKDFKILKAFYVNNGEVVYVDGERSGDNYIFTVPHFTVVGVQGSIDNSESGEMTKNVTLAVDTSKTFTQDGEYSYTDSDEYVDIATEIKDKDADPYYESATFSAGEFYISSSSGDTNPAVQLTFEAAGNGQYYIKNADGTYIYPNASYSRGNWSYTVGQGNVAVNVNTNTDGSVVISREVTSGKNGKTAYLSASVTSSGSQSSIYLYNRIVPEASKQTSVTFTGKKIGTTQVTIGNVQYNIEVTARGGSYNTSVAVGGSTQLTIPDTVGAEEKVVWSSSDYTKAGVYSEDSQNATITGREEGNTVVTATVYDNEGKQAAVYTWNVTVTEGTLPSAGNYTVTITSENTIYNGKLYYSLAGGSLVEVPVSETTTDEDGNTIYTYEKIDLTVANVKYTQLELFVKPDDGYAVTSITDTTGKSYSQFYGIDKEDVQVIYASGHQGGKLEDALTTEQEKALLSEAIATGCDAVFWYTRGTKSTNLTANMSIDSKHIIHCDKLPTISKKITYLKVGDEYTPYTEGMVAHEGDTAVFKITVTKYKETADINYTDAKVTDIMQNVSGSVQLYKDTKETTRLENPFDISDTLNAGDGTEVTTYDYYATYTITKEDLDKEFVNTVNLSYDYSSQYSTGKYGGAATDNAKFIATNFPGIKDIVIDYGLPVTVKVGAWESAAGAGAVTVTGTADYGTVTVTGDNTTGIAVTYTPDKVLKSEDTVVLTAVSADGKNKVDYSFKVYPATTVYYEEGFADYSKGWTGASTGTDNQVKSEVGSGNSYGFDEKYANEAVASNGTAAVTFTQGSTAEFTFKGTGVDIYANCTNATGVVSVIRKQDGTIQSIEAVNTEAKAGDTGNTALPGSRVAYNVPIVSEQDLPYGEYTAKITFSRSNRNTEKSVSIDGFRVYNTLTDEAAETNVYAKDNEANPKFVELRDQLLSVLNVSNYAEKYADQIAKNTLSQVYSSAGATSGAIILTNSEDKITNPYVDVDVKDLLENGPKNEIYLYKGRTIVFNLNSSYQYQIGLKALNGAVNLTLNGESMNLNSSTDMFYAISGSTVTLTNNSDNILSITKLKAIGAGNISTQSLFAPLTEESLTAALVGLGYEKEPEAVETPAPTATVTPTAAPTTRPAQSVKPATKPGKVTVKTPVLRKAKRISSKKAVLSWKKVSGANGYVVYRKTNNGRWQVVKRITKGNITSFTDKKLSKGKKYTYTVRAYRTVGGKNIYSGYNKKGLKIK